MVLRIGLHVTVVSGFIVKLLDVPSDGAQGGDDDVIGCKRDRKLSSKVVAMSLGNLVKHTPPKEKKHRLVLKDGRLQDGHIYCRVMRPLKVKLYYLIMRPVNVKLY